MTNWSEIYLNFYCFFRLIQNFVPVTYQKSTNPTRDSTQKSHPWHPWQSIQIWVSWVTFRGTGKNKKTRIYTTSLGWGGFRFWIKKRGGGEILNILISILIHYLFFLFSVCQREDIFSKAYYTYLPIHFNNFFFFLLF